MDHILEHEADPVPDLANTAVGSAAPAATQNAMDVDDDEDNEALRAALKLSQAPDGGASSGAADAPAEAGAKVCLFVRAQANVRCIMICLHVHVF
jgi:hypothetical protein